jgi:hypothetical protein
MYICGECKFRMLKINEAQETDNLGRHLGRHTDSRRTVYGHYEKLTSSSAFLANVCPQPARAANLRNEKHSRSGECKTGRSVVQEV